MPSRFIWFQVLPVTSFLYNTQKQPFADVLKNKCSKKFRKFTWNHLCLSLFFNKVAGWGFKKRLWQVFSVNFAKTFKNTCFLEHLRTAASNRTPRVVASKHWKLVKQIFFLTLNLHGNYNHVDLNLKWLVFDNKVRHT